MDAALHAIADPRRRLILEIVAHDERTAGEIAANFDVSRPAISQHLSVLKNANLLDERREGTRRYYRARREGLDELREYLEHFWDTQLDRLERAAELKERMDADGSDE
jgi:DNA-binding transcriptional ArsR family regulator